MAGALLLVDVLKAFEHEDGDRLLASFRARHAGLTRAIDEARSAATPIVYANDSGGVSDSDAGTLVRRAIAGKGGELVEAVAPRSDDRVVLKARYSAFDETALATLLRELDVDDLRLAGTATEMCVFMTTIDALRAGFEVTVLADACATVDERNEALALEYLQQVLGVEVVGGA